jgi:flagellar hook protein FlgE
LPSYADAIICDSGHFVVGMVPADLPTSQTALEQVNMSLFGAINTAVSGLSAQSTAFGNISEDVANSQTVGFKRVDTSFVDYLTTSTATVNEPGSVVALPNYVNDVQGSVTQTDNPLGMAIAGQGFFAVSQPTGATNGVTTYNPQQFYTRNGDFSMNASGFLVNSSGQYLNGWLVNPATKAADQNALVPIQVSQQTFNPVPTSSVTLAANLPATPAAGTAVAAYTNASGTVVPAAPLSSQITVYDALGTAHTVTLNWTQTPDPASTAIPPKVLPNSWNVQMQVADATGNLADGTGAYIDAGSATVTFGDPNTADADPTVPPAGTIDSVIATAATTVPPSGAATVIPTGAGSGTYDPGVSPQRQDAATLQFHTNFGSGDQLISLNLGTYGGTSGVTQFAGKTYSLLGLTQDGVPPGSFSGVTTEASGNVVVNYNNGQTKTIAQIPLVTFNAPNALQSQNGQSFTATPASGSPLAVAASTNGAGDLVVGSLEGSNVDIATEFTNLIVAQQAYSSNAKVVTTANMMLQATLQMVA